MRIGTCSWMVFAGLGLLLGLGWPVFSKEPEVVRDEGRGSAALRARADAIREPAQALFKLKAIPWVTDVFEGFRLARKERRPVFLYTVVGDPLEDC